MKYLMTLYLFNILNGMDPQLAQMEQGINQKAHKKRKAEGRRSALHTP